jgi:DNA-binding CsgD family transcriptional regulator
MSRLRCPVVVGREPVLHDGRDALASAAAGRGRCIAVVGEPGIGKSRVLSELAQEGRGSELAILAGRSVSAGRPSPYMPLAEALAQLLRRAAPGDPASLAPFVPALAGVVPAWPAASGAGPPPPFAVAETTLRLLRTLAPQGAVVLLDDLHWGDVDTLAAVELLADNAGDEPLLLVMAGRPNESRGLDELVRSLAARGTVQEHRLDPLGRRDLRRMARACLDGGVSPALVDLLAERSDGVPLLVEELLASWHAHRVVVPRDGGWEVARPPAGDGRASLAASVADRLSSFDAAGRAALDAAAVLGRIFDWRTAARVAGIDEDRMGSVMDAALAQHLVEEHPDGGPHSFRFRHAPTRDALLGALPPWQRRRLFRDALDEVHAGDAEAPRHDQQLAELAEGAGETEIAARHLLAVGRRHHRRGALATAETVLERGLSLTDEPSTVAELATELVEVLALAGRARRAHEVGDARHATAETASDAVHVRLHLALGRAAEAQGEWGLARRHLDEARPRATDEGLLRRVELVAAGIAAQQGAGVDARAHALRALGDDAPPEERCEALEVLGRYARLHDPAEAELLLTRMRDVAETHSLASWRVRSLVELTAIDVFRLRTPEHLAAAHDEAVQIGDVRSALRLRLLDAIRRYQAFELNGREGQLLRVMTSATRHGLTHVAAAARHVLAGLRVQSGRGSDIGALGDDPPQGIGEQLDVIGSSFVRAIGALLGEEPDSARRWLDQGADAGAARRARWCGEWGLWALVHALDGDATAVTRLRDRGIAEHRVNAGLAAWCDAVLAGMAGRREDAVAQAARAMSLLEPAPWYDSMARRLVCETALAAGWGHPDWLTPAVAFSDGAGQVRVADACRVLLRRAGQRPLPRQVPAQQALTPFGLSARELDVIGLVERGFSNRAVASQLSISHRTVEKHVERLLAKTAAHNRAELGAIAVRISRQAPVDGA